MASRHRDNIYEKCTQSEKAKAVALKSLATSGKTLEHAGRNIPQCTAAVTTDTQTVAGSGRGIAATQAVLHFSTGRTEERLTLVTVVTMRRAVGQEVSGWTREEVCL